MKINLKILMAVLVAAVLAGCRYDDCVVGGVDNPENGVERVEWTREVKRGTSRSSFDVSVDMPKDEEYRKVVEELIGRAWRHGVGQSERKIMPENLKDVFTDFRSLAEEIYPADFDGHNYGVGGDVQGRMVAMGDMGFKYRLRAVFQPFGNSAYGCEYEVEYRAYDRESRVKSRLDIREVQLSDFDTWQ